MSVGRRGTFYVARVLKYDVASRLQVPTVAASTVATVGAHGSYDYTSTSRRGYDGYYNGRF